MTATEHVILVDEEDTPQGTDEKLAAHRAGLCHRAFSVFIFRHHDNVEVLLQQRANHKYHSPGLWTNTCCSHPRPNEEIIQAGERRLKEEMGIETPLISAGRFHYIAHFSNGLTENEVDHVLIGRSKAEQIAFNPEEVQDYRWITLSALQQELARHPEHFTPWFARALQIAEAAVTKRVLVLK